MCVPVCGQMQVVFGGRIYHNSFHSITFLLYMCNMCMWGIEIWVTDEVILNRGIWTCRYYSWKRVLCPIYLVISFLLLLFHSCCGKSLLFYDIIMEISFLGDWLILAACEGTIIAQWDADSTTCTPCGSRDCFVAGSVVAVQDGDVGAGSMKWSLGISPQVIIYHVELVDMGITYLAI